MFALKHSMACSKQIPLCYSLSKKKKVLRQTRRGNPCENTAYRRNAKANVFMNFLFPIIQSWLHQRSVNCNTFSQVLRIVIGISRLRGHFTRGNVSLKLEQGQ